MNTNRHEARPPPAAVNHDSQRKFLEANPIVIGILAFLAIAALVLSVLAILMSRAGVRAASAPPFGAAELAQMTIIPPRTDGSR